MKNGYVFKKAKTKMASLNIVFNAGSAYEKEGQYGVHHLMEHLITKAIDEYQDRFLNDCIEFNAYTSANRVVVYFKGLDSKLPAEFKQELVAKVLNGLADVTEEMFDNEKQIVLQEIFDSFEDPLEGNTLNFIYSHFGVTMPTGIPDYVALFTYEEAKKKAKELFSKPIRIVDVAKQPTEYKVEYNTEYAEPVVPKYKKTNNIIKDASQGDKVNVLVSSKRVVNKAESPYIAFAIGMLSCGLSSPLYQEIREKRGLSYFVSGDMHNFEKRGIVMFSACTTKEKIKEIKSVFEEILNNTDKYLTQERFDIIKNLTLTHREIQKCQPYGDIEKLISPEDTRLPEKLDKIKFEKVKEVTKKYFGKNLIIHLC